MNNNKEKIIENSVEVTQAFFDEIRENAEASFYGLSVGDSSAKKRAAITSMVLAAKIKVSQDIPTAAAYFETKNGIARPVIIVNVDFYNKMKKWGSKEFGLMCHELFHLIMRHFDRFTMPKDPNEKQLLNIALDCAINQIIVEFAGFNPTDKQWESLQAGKKDVFNCVNYHTFCRMFKLAESDVEKNREAEYYYQLAKQNADKLPPPQGGGGKDGEQGGDGWSQGENHEGHFDLNDKPTPEELEAARDYVKRQFTLHGVSLKDFGIDDLQSGVIRWKNIIRQFVSRSVKADIRNSRNRPNRRHGWLAPKKVSDRKPELVFVADSSGSMICDFPIMANEVFSLAKAANLQSVDVYYIDTQLHAKGVYKKGQPFPPIKGGGGTAFTQPFADLGQRIKKGQSVIFFTDCETSDWPYKKPGFPLLIISTKPESRYLPEWAKPITIDASDLITEARRQLAA